MDRIVLWVAMCFLSINIVNSQQKVFFNSYDLDGDDFGIVIIEADSNYYVSCSKNGIVGNTISVLLKISPQGDTLGVYNYDYSPVGTENGYAMVFDSFDQTINLFTTYFDTIVNIRNCYLNKVDFNGTTKLLKQISLNGVNEITEEAINKKTKQGYVCGGYYNVAFPNGKIFITSIDTSGNIEWQQEYGCDTCYSYLNSLDNTLDGGYVVAGNVSYSNIQGHGYVLKTDSIGNELWRKDFLAPRMGLGIIKSIADSGFILLGIAGEAGFLEIFDTYLFKLDALGNTIWYKNIGQQNKDDGPAHIRVLQDGSYIVGGTGWNDSSQVSCRILKIDVDGNIIWERIHHYEGIVGVRGDYYMRDMIVGKDGSIAATGFVVPENIPNKFDNDIFILKVDSCGYGIYDSTVADFTIELSENQVTATLLGSKVCQAKWYWGTGDSTNSRNPAPFTYTDTGTYTIMLITYAGNAIDTAYQTVNITTVGIDDPQTPKGGLRVYPNPASSEIKIEMNNLQSSINEVKVYDVAGRIVHSQLSAVHSSVTKINVSDLEMGLYFIEVMLSNGSVERVKFIKQ